MSCKSWPFCTNDTQMYSMGGSNWRRNSASSMSWQLDWTAPRNVGIFWEQDSTRPIQSHLTWTETQPAKHTLAVSAAQSISTSGTFTPLRAFSLPPRTTFTWGAKSQPDRQLDLGMGMASLKQWLFTTCSRENNLVWGLGLLWCYNGGKGWKRLRRSRPQQWKQWTYQMEEGTSMLTGIPPPKTRHKV